MNRWALGAMMLPGVAFAQNVRGTITEQASQRPIAGAVVFLIDSNSAVVARDLTSETGSYRLSAPRAGTYRVRTLRIGFRPVVSAALQLSEGPDATLPLAIESVPVSLGAVRVERRANCPARQDVARAYNAWNEVVTALNAALLSSRLRGTSATILGYDRWTAPGSNVVLRQGMNVKSGMSGQPWRSIPADSLHRTGFVVTDDAGVTTYFAPDLDVLLSDVFLQDHCLQLRDAKDGAIAIEFTPARDRGRIPEIRGFVWLDSASLELRRLQFRYVNVPAAISEVDAGGELEFLKLRSGHWVISRWEVRMPSAMKQDRSESYAGLRSSPSIRVTEVKATGGDLLSVVQGDDTLWALPPRAFQGTVLDSASGRPVAGARVFISGTAYSTTADARGRFHIPDMLPGAYTLLVHTAELDSLAARHVAPVLLVEQMRDVEVRVAGPASVIRRWCPAIPRNEHSASNVPLGMLLGVVIAHDSTPVHGAGVVLAWNEFTIGPAGVTVRPRRITVTTDSEGVYRACGVPTAQWINLGTEFDGSAFPTPVRIESDSKTKRLDIRLDENRRRIIDGGGPGQGSAFSFTSVTSGHAPTRNGIPQ